MIYSPGACLKLLADNVEYAERYADMTDQPKRGDCRRAVARAKSLLEDAAKAQAAEAPATALRHQAQLLAYVEHYAPPGHFLGAVLRNDLAAAFLHAQPGDVAEVPLILAWLHAHGPLKCWGSADAVAAWVANYDDGVPF